MINEGSHTSTFSNDSIVIKINNNNVKNVASQQKDEEIQDVEEEKSMVKLDEPGLETVDMDEFNNSCVFDECANTHSTVFR